MSNYKLSNYNWVFINIIIPLVPFFLESLINLLIMLPSNPKGILEAFNVANLGISCGMLSFFFSQSLFSKKLLLPNRYEEDDRYRNVLFFNLLGGFSFLFFGLLIFLSKILSENENFTNYKQTLIFLKLIIVSLSSLIIIGAVLTRKSYK